MTNQSSKLGKIREADVPVLTGVIEVCKSHNLQSGIHGTSLWNASYKDIDLLVIGEQEDFKGAMSSLVRKHGASIIGQKGDGEIGLDYELSIDGTILHISYVVLL